METMNSLKYSKDIEKWRSLSLGRLDGSPENAALSIIFEEKHLSVLVVYDKNGNPINIKVDDRSV